MLGESHDLLHEFPNLEEKIATLRSHDTEFAQMMDDYDALDARVRDLEELGTPVADETIEEAQKGAPGPEGHALRHPALLRAGRVADCGSLNRIRLGAGNPTRKTSSSAHGMSPARIARHPGRRRPFERPPRALDNPNTR